MRKLPLMLLAGALASVITLTGQEKGGGYETGDYEVVSGWPQALPNHEGWVSAPVTAVFAESPDRVFYIQRGELPRPEGRRGGPPPTLFATPGRSATSAIAEAKREHYVLVANREGKIVETWTQWDKMWDGSRGPHHIKINPYDPEKHVWIIDDDLQQIFKFTNDGKKLVMTIGERLVRGNDRQPLRPAHRHRLAARRHVLHHRRLSEPARPEVRQGRQVPHDVGEGGIRPG